MKKVGGNDSGKVAKVIMLGKSNSGKSCLVDRYVLGDFDHHKESTIGLVQAHNKEEIENKEIRLFIWDTAGCERYRALASMYYRDAVAAVVCYDITDRKSWEDVPYWLNGIIDKTKCAVYLVGNKKDLLTEKWSRVHRVTAAEEIVNLVSTHHDVDIRRSYETSSRTGENVDLLFRDIANDFAERLKVDKEARCYHDRFMGSHKTIRLQEVKEQSNSCCSFHQLQIYNARAQENR